MAELEFILSRINFSAIVDILLVALIFYWILTLLQGTQAVQLLRGILVLSVLAIIAAGLLRSLTAFSWLIEKALPALLVAIPIIFQPELRRALERVGRTSKVLLGARQNPEIEETIIAVSRAAPRLSELKHGALIVVERETGLEDHIETGVRVGATVTPELLTTIFYPGTALHDGAVIIRGNKIIAAATVLPLGGSMTAGTELGTRHRAALGITETTDAVVVIVSEETGRISVVENGRLIKGRDGKRVEQLLRMFFRDQLNQAFFGSFGHRQSLWNRLGFGKSNNPGVQPQSKK